MEPLFSSLWLLSLALQLEYPITAQNFSTQTLSTIVTSCQAAYRSQHFAFASSNFETRLAYGSYRFSVLTARPFNRRLSSFCHALQARGEHSILSSKRCSSFHLAKFQASIVSSAKSVRHLTSPFSGYLSQLCCLKKLLTISQSSPKCWNLLSASQIFEEQLLLVHSLMGLEVDLRSWELLPLIWQIVLLQQIALQPISLFASISLASFSTSQLPSLLTF